MAVAPIPAYKPQGYHKLAALMAEDNSIAIFRCFDYINMLSLLSLQAEIIDLQGHFRYQCQLDDNSLDVDEKSYSQWFLKLQESQGSDADQYRMLKELRGKVKEYSELKIIHLWSQSRS